MVDTDPKRNMKLKLKVLKVELRMRVLRSKSSLKGYNRTVKMIEDLERRIAK